MMRAAVVSEMTTSPQQITLTANSYWAAYCNPDEIQIECQEGEAWITQEDDHRDIILQAEQRYRVERQGLVIVQAIGAARILITYI